MLQYIKDWLKGYKEIEIPKALMQEYNAIEQTSKASKFSKLSEVYDVVGHLLKNSKYLKRLIIVLLTTLKIFSKDMYLLKFLKLQISIIQNI